MDAELHGVPKSSLMTPLYQSAVSRVSTEYQRQAKRGNIEYKSDPMATSSPQQQTWRGGATNSFILYFPFFVSTSLFSIISYSDFFVKLVCFHCIFTFFITLFGWGRNVVFGSLLTSREDFFTVSRWRPLPSYIQKLYIFLNFETNSSFFSETLRRVRDAGHPRGQAQHPDLAERGAEDVDGGGGVRALGRRRRERVRHNEKTFFAKLKTQNCLD